MRTLLFLSLALCAAVWPTSAEPNRLTPQEVADGNSGVLEGPNWRKQARLDAGTISLQAHDPTTNLDYKDIRAVELPAR